MRVFSLVDSSGKVEAFYTDDIYAADQLPEGVVEISVSDWMAYLSTSGCTFSNGHLTPPPVAP